MNPDRPMIRDHFGKAVYYEKETQLLILGYSIINYYFIMNIKNCIIAKHFNLICRTAFVSSIAKSIIKTFPFC